MQTFLVGIRVLSRPSRNFGGRFPTDIHNQVIILEPAAALAPVCHVTVMPVVPVPAPSIKLVIIPILDLWDLTISAVTPTCVLTVPGVSDEQTRVGSPTVILVIITVTSVSSGFGAGALFPLTTSVHLHFLSPVAGEVSSAAVRW